MVKKPYHLRAVGQPELDIHGIASKAAVYHIPISPIVIEQGFTAAIELMYYLVASGYSIKTPLFSLRMRIPGEYSGMETTLPEGVHPVPRLQISKQFRNYLKNKVKLEIDGFDHSNGLIIEALDEATGLINQGLTPGNFLTIQGYGLKMDSDTEHKLQTGAFFKPESGELIKAPLIAINEPKRIKLIVPNELKPGIPYRIFIETMSSSKGSGALTKKIRDICSDFSLVA